jgi:hypothetical protein
MSTTDDGIYEFTIGEIFDVSISTTKHIEKYGTYVSEIGEDNVFNKCDISKMTTFTATRGDSESSHWNLSLEDFLPSMLDPSFRLCEEKNINFYSTFVFLVPG